MNIVKYGIVMPVSNPQNAIELAVQAEQSGWDGFFMADGMWGLDTWLCLSAAATQTDKIRLGTLLTPLSIMRPWKLASQAATLDHISNGRAILTIGMGAPDVGFEAFGEASDLRTRAELVDEGLDIITKMWQGEAFQHKGKHYQIDLETVPFRIPHPVQKPGIPIWVVAAWPRPKSMNRALRCDGLIPTIRPKDEDPHTMLPAHLQDIQSWINERHSRASSFDYVIEGQTPIDDRDKAQAIIQKWQEVGMTWWIESLWDVSLEMRMGQLRQGPPKL